MNAIFSNALTSWKSTAQSILTVTLSVSGVLMASSIIKPATAAVLVTVNGIAKVLIGLMQQDAKPSISNPT